MILLSVDLDIPGSGQQQQQQEQQQQHAYDYINKLRREEFGVGVKLTEDGEKLMEKQQQRLGKQTQQSQVTPSDNTCCVMNNYCKL